MILISDYERYGDFPYEITEEKTISAVMIQDVKLQLSVDGNERDEFIKNLINTAVLFFEGFCKKTLLTKTYKTYRTVWGIYRLRRCPLQSIISIKYYDESGNQQTLSASNYYIVKNNNFSNICFSEEFEAPSLRNRPHQIEIEFKAGFGDSINNIPADIQHAIIEHVSYMYENKGDCVDDTCHNITVPNTTKLAYAKYKIQEVGA